MPIMSRSTLPRATPFTSMATSGPQTRTSRVYDIDDPGGYAKLGDSYGRLDALKGEAAQRNAAGGSSARFGGGGGGYGGELSYYDRGRLTTPAAEASRYGTDAQRFAAQLGFNSQAADRAAAQERFNRVFGQLQGIMAGGAGGPARIGGNSGAGPDINVGGVWNPELVEQQVNAARSSAQQGATSAYNRFADESAGRGFAASSPMLAAMRNQLDYQAGSRSADQEREIRLQAGLQNREQVLAQQSAREQQFSNRQQEDIARRRAYTDTQNAWLAALSGLV